MQGEPGRARPCVAAGLACDEGMVTAELAVALPALMLVLALALGVLAVGTARLRCADAAQSAGRLAARGEPLEAVRAAATRAAERPVGVRVSEAGDLVTVEVTTSVSLPGGWLPGVTVREQVTQLREPGVAP